MAKDALYKLQQMRSLSSGPKGKVLCYGFNYLIERI